MLATLVVPFAVCCRSIGSSGEQASARNATCQQNRFTLVGGESWANWRARTKLRCSACSRTVPPLVVLLARLILMPGARGACRNTLLTWWRLSRRKRILA